MQSQKIDKGLKLGIKEVEVLYYLCSANKGADQLADLHLCFHICQKLVFSIFFVYVLFLGSDLHVQLLKKTLVISYFSMVAISSDCNSDFHFDFKVPFKYKVTANGKMQKKNMKT